VTAPDTRPRAVTLSDGSVWTLADDGVWLDQYHDNDGSSLTPYLLNREGVREPLTAADFRAIADVLDPQPAGADARRLDWSVAGLPGAGTMRRRKILKSKAGLKPKVANPRKTHIKRKPRSASEFNRIYGSKERVAFVQSLRCVRCKGWPSENAHIPHPDAGMGRKGPYTAIISLCRSCHVWFDRQSAEIRKDKIWKSLAELVEELWLNHRRGPV